MHALRIILNIIILLPDISDFNVQTGISFSFLSLSLCMYILSYQVNQSYQRNRPWTSQSALLGCILTVQGEGIALSFYFKLSIFITCFYFNGKAPCDHMLTYVVHIQITYIKVLSLRAWTDMIHVCTRTVLLAFVSYFNICELKGRVKKKKRLKYFLTKY